MFNGFLLIVQVLLVVNILHLHDLEDQVHLPHSPALWPVVATIPLIAVVFAVQFVILWQKAGRKEPFK